ncbi:MAG: copper resistance protein NlpE N-terminal domain-containing protein [Flavobacteriales bacterium]
MKLIHALPVVLVLLASCQGSPQDEKTPEGVETEETTGATQWVGLYSDTLPCADCPGILTQLDLRADSTYVMRDRYLERDSIPYGTIGQWTVSGDMLTLNTADVPIRWKLEGDRLVRRYADGGPVETTLPNSIGRVANFGSLPMHLSGAYVYYADSHSFTPCGSKFIIPVAMDEAGVEGAGLELERAYSNRIKTPPDPLFVEVTATLRVGPAMEGDDTEEYLYIERLERVKELQKCP